MTDAVKSRVFRLLLRLAGLAAVAAGGWCCWLALSGSRPSAETEAFQDWSRSQPSQARSESGPPPRRLAAEITEITPVAGLDPEGERVIFAEFDELDGERQSLQVVRHDREIGVADSTTRESTGAWLTGTIEDDDAPGRNQVTDPAQVPVWKRSRKTPKPTRRTSSSATLPLP